MYAIEYAIQEYFKIFSNILIAQKGQKLITRIFPDSFKYVQKRADRPGPLFKGLVKAAKEKKKI